ncbi:hypothetical protein BT96DRAFT_815224 [Gymnopus androsaceus JB14]|uniref:UbiA prenyltransferase n=1 Tax=Gymnopus androsaceus JB14 TaxID=1447944 RepID=A0A6A4I2E4_9AGAR|nr:hypothetical protein BT96DRAFT_815224 [Gymnopus androsaceus JB14]
MSILSVCYTLILFVRSDIKTILLPVSLFTLITAGRPWDPVGAANASLWLLVHLLQFNFSNQLVALEEDICNKPYRPLPSRRITVETVDHLRIGAKFVCLVLSYGHGHKVFYTSSTLIVLCMLYNEADGARFVIARTILNAFGVSLYFMGTILVFDNHRDSHTTAVQAILVNAGVLATTLHAQDFRDIKGDLQSGRNTIPISQPILSRYSILVGLIFWAKVFNVQWSFGPIADGLFIFFSFWVGIRYCLLTSVRDDTLSYRWYNVCLEPSCPVLGKN